MKIQLLSILVGLNSLLALGQNSSPTPPHDFFTKDSLSSSLDGNTQVFYYRQATGSEALPLVVALHSWSNTADSQKNLWAEIAQYKDWNYIVPNFRGVNNHPKACCSEFAIADIDEAIDWALKNLHIDQKRIYVIGFSGGGYATLSMFMKSRHAIRAFSAWASISDLAAWYGESVERKNKYAAEIVKCTGAGEVFDEQKAKERSPLHWQTPVKQRKKSQLQIYAGIHDGYTGSVPISHSIHFYNKLIADFKEKNKASYVSTEDAATLLNTQSYPASTPAILLEDRVILYQKAAKNISLTIFEGTHEILKKAALDKLEEKR